MLELVEGNTMETLAWLNDGPFETVFWGSLSLLAVVGGVALVCPRRFFAWSTFGQQWVAGAQFTREAFFPGGGRQAQRFSRSMGAALLIVVIMLADLYVHA
jgi:hypothetical protein